VNELAQSRAATRKEESGSGIEGISAATVKTWSRGNNDMVSSTKMIEMTRLLKEWEASGDKIIVYSQCKLNYICILNLSKADCTS
jgi:hypothetical protein